MKTVNAEVLIEEVRKQAVALGAAGRLYMKLENFMEIIAKCIEESDPPLSHTESMVKDVMKKNDLLMERNAQYIETINELKTELADLKQAITDNGGVILERGEAIIPLDKLSDLINEA